MQFWRSERIRQAGSCDLRARLQNALKPALLIALALTFAPAPSFAQQANDAPADTNAAPEARAHRAAPRRKAAAAPARPTVNEREAMRARANASTVAIVSGNITGTYLRMAADIASVLDDGDRLRVLPILAPGAVQNVSDILFLKGVDMGFVRTDSVEAIRRAGKLGDVRKEIAYIARLVDDEMHVIAPNAITDLKQLEGKKVNFDVVGSGTHFSTQLVFEKLGVKVEPTAYEQNVAYEKLKAGEIAASVFFGGKPVGGVAAFNDPEKRFHLVPVRYDQSLEEFYLPGRLTGKDYPNLLKPDETIDTVSASTVLAVYNMPQSSERYERVAKFVDAFFGKFDQFQKAPRHPKWREVNLSATAPGWVRFKPAQDWLDRAAQAQSAAGGASSAGAQSADALSHPAVNRDADDVERFRRFVAEKSPSGSASLSPQDAVRLFREFQEQGRKP